MTYTAWVWCAKCHSVPSVINSPWKWWFSLNWISYTETTLFWFLLRVLPKFPSPVPLVKKSSSIMTSDLGTNANANSWFLIMFLIIRNFLCSFQPNCNAHFFPEGKSFASTSAFGLCIATSENGNILLEYLKWMSQNFQQNVQHSLPKAMWLVHQMLNSILSPNRHPNFGVKPLKFCCQRTISLTGSVLAWQFLVQSQRSVFRNNDFAGFSFLWWTN